MNVSEPVRAILDHLRSEYGSTEITAQQAKQLFCGDDDCVLGDLDDEALIQLALVQAHDALEAHVHENAGLQLALMAMSKGPNRATRRHSK